MVPTAMRSEPNSSVPISVSISARSVGLASFLGKPPQLAAARDRRMIVEEHAMGIAALASLERDRNDLSALRVIAESGRIRHAEELKFHQRLFDLQRFGHQLAQLLRIGAICDD
jgi:hypothetical protein